MHTYHEIRQKYSHLKMQILFFSGEKEDGGAGPDAYKEQASIITTGVVFFNNDWYYLPDMSDPRNDPMLLDEYLERALENIFRNYDPIFFYVGYPKAANKVFEKYGYRHGIYFLPIGANCYHEINNGLVHSIEVHEDYGGATKQSFTLLHGGRRFMKNESPQSQWLDSIKSKYDLYANPANVHLLDRLPFIKRSENLYQSEDLFLDINWFMKVSGCWLKIDKKWFREHLDELPSHIIEQVLLYDSSM